ncbi:hypothetical protein K438DRAFT_1646954 [Mycena galopus ATCC 62051]|nr:hypothetical protein K438DRAFT_1646954 [Mycena galopus ATCC 62051]
MRARKVIASCRRSIGTVSAALCVSPFAFLANTLPCVVCIGVGGSGPDALVSKQNVTTVRTSKASHNRRKQETTFVCPVPGCGSTFMRSFNLKGHIRSHNAEKPFLCKWPGCGKGFVRQHDCKRHEQLHTDYRPFCCEGCGKQFARMDALNRHCECFVRYIIFVIFPAHFSTRTTGEREADERTGDHHHSRRFRDESAALDPSAR